MVVSRRLRFEILRRDGYTCRYCGAQAPDAKLTVDHVVPTTLGGGDDPRNLVTACHECNAGKTSIAPDAVIVADVDATVMLFAQAMERVAAARIRDRELLQAGLDHFDQEWLKWHNYADKPLARDRSWPETVERFLGLGLELEDLTHFIGVAMRSRADNQDTNTWRYFCGCCWREVTTRQELARRAIEDGDV